MKSRAQIEAWLRRLIRAELERRIKEAQTRLPRFCVHNHRQPLDYRKEVEGVPNPGYNQVSAGHGDDGRALPVVQTIGLCMLKSESPDEWKGDICEDPEDALTCPYFQSRLNLKRVIDDFVSELKHTSRRVSPEIETLFLVLEDHAVLCVPWWLRWWYWLRGWKIQDVQEPLRTIGWRSEGIVNDVVDDTRKALGPGKGAAEG